MICSPIVPYRKIDLPNAYVYKILVPEFTKDDIKFEITSDKLIITYDPIKLDSSTFITNRYELLTSISLKDNTIDKNHIDIRMDSDIVTVTIPKLPPRSIPVQ
jgi:HSP20 family molecular chaperone IbpA